MDIPPVVVHGPIAITSFGSRIWSYNLIKVRAIFIITVLVVKVKLACLGLDLVL